MITSLGDCIKGVFIGMFAALLMTALIDQMRQVEALNKALALVAEAGYAEVAE